MKEQRNFDNIFILPNWLPVSPATTRKHWSNVTQRRTIMEAAYKVSDSLTRSV